MAERCHFCNEEHEPGPVGIEGGAFAGVQFKVCPAIPPDLIYEDREFETGPRGALHRLPSERFTEA